MATVSSLLKIVQAFVACIIFGRWSMMAAMGAYVAHPVVCAVYSLCFLATVAGVVVLSVLGHTGPGLPLRPCGGELYTFLATLLYLSAAVIWPVFCDPKCGEPGRPPDCSRAAAQDSQLVVAIFTYINLLFYVMSLAYSQRIRLMPTF